MVGEGKQKGFLSFVGGYNVITRRKYFTENKEKG